MTQVSLSTNYSGEQNALIEELGTALTVNFELDQAAPNGGLKVFVDSDISQIINRLDLPGFAFNPTTENIDPATFGTSFDNSGFYLTIDEGATSGSFTINVFDNEEPDTFLPETFDGLVSANFFLVAPDAVSEEDKADVGTLGDYTINPDSASSTVIFADEENQLTDTPTPPTNPEPPAPEGLQVSLFTGPDYLIEDEGTVSAHAFLATNGVIPEGGLIVSVDAPNLGEFHLAGVSVEGGEIAAVRDGGFDLLMTEYTTLVNLPIADDGETEIGETATFILAEGNGYEVVEDYSGDTFNLVDTRDDIPLGIVTEPNDIVSVVTDTEITSENPSFSAASSIYFDIGNRYLNEDGTYSYIDYNEDVDLYQVNLSAGDTIAVETFEVAGNRDVNNFGFFSGLAVLDANGNRLSFAGFTTPAAPDKLFGGVSAFNEDGTVNLDETDTYIEFTAPEDGTYYVGVATTESTYPLYFGEDYTYSLEIPGLGDNNRVLFANYEIEIDLMSEENPRKTGTPTLPVSNLNVTNPPTLSLSANPTTVDSEGNFTNAVVEFVEDDGVSGVNFTIRAEGEIPEGGIEFVLNSNTNLFDYISLLGQDRLPSTIGGQSLGAFYNEDGIPTGIRLLIEKPTMTVNYETANRADSLIEILGLEPLLDEYEPLETDGTEDVTFFLQPGEGYEIDSNTGTAEVTYYDSLEDVPGSTGGGDTVPEVGVTVSETELIESEGTETTLTFTLSEPPPAEGVTVYLDSENEPLIGSVLGQFLVLESVIEGGNFPVPNSDSSGFFFNITQQTATITLSVFDELSVTDEVFAVQEGLVAIDFALVPQAGYTIDESASEINFTIADNPESQVLIVPTAATVDGDGSTTLIESEGSVGVLNLNLSTLPPAEGITTTISTSSLDDFDVDAIEVEGGTISEIRDNGFDVTVTERQAKINLPVSADGTTEVSETATFTIEPGEDYELSDLTEVTFTLADTPDQASVSEEIEGNDILSEANALGLSANNSTVSINGALSGFGSTTPERFFGFAEDVDFYSVTLDAGQTVALDIDTVEPAPADNFFTVFPALEEVLQKTDTELRLFDADGNELAANNDGAAPNEEFSRDPYLEFTAETAGTYYVGVSQLGNRNYDPNVVRSGSGWTFPEVGVFFGDYELTASLVDGTVNPPEQPTIMPVFGSIDGDAIEMDGSNQLIFAGDMNDLVDASTGEGENRIYAGSGDDTVILGSSDRVLAGAGNDTIFVTSGGDNIITGGVGADQFWIASAELPESANIITDFMSGEDVIGLAGLSIGFSDFTITDLEGDALISFNDSEIAILQGINPTVLSQNDFAFA